MLLWLFNTMTGETNERASVLLNLVDGTPLKDRTQFNVIEMFHRKEFCHHCVNNTK